jgi:CheY-like chemotaxis protein
VHVPIIAMTAHALKGDRERCLAAGIDGYVSKPIDTAVLLDEINRVLPPVVRARLSAPAAVGTSPVSDSPVSGDVVNRAQLWAHVGGDHAFLRALVDLYVQTYPELLADIEKALATGDGARLARAAHTLKGAVGNFKATSAYAAALAVEELGHGDDRYAMQEALGGLKRELERLRRDLTELVAADAPSRPEPRA